MIDFQDLSAHPTILALRARIEAADTYEAALRAILADPSDAVAIASLTLGVVVERPTEPVSYDAPTMPDASALVVAHAEEPAS